jgi:hypothetical protein
MSEEMMEILRAQIIEIEKYKWCLGIQLGHDPLDDRTLNEICHEWILLYASGFREYWNQTHEPSNYKYTDTEISGFCSSKM